MADQYQVVGECAHVVVADVSGVSAMTLLYKGAPVPDGVDEKRLKHLIDSGLVAKVEGVPLAPNAAVQQDPTVGVPTSQPGAGDKTDSGSGDGLHPTLTDEQREAQAKQADAKAKLPADGSAPHHNASDAVWVEYAVVRGMDRDEATKAGKEEIRKTLAAQK